MSVGSGSIEAEDVSKVFFFEDRPSFILEKINLDIKSGEFVALVGPTGSGKTTLLNLLTGLYKPNSGRILVNGFEITKMKEDAVSEIRANYLGIMFQNINLLPGLSILENVELPILLRGKKDGHKRDKAIDLLKLVGLMEKMEYYPPQLSMGELRKVGIARALVTDPEILVLDEPTGDLDILTVDELLILLRSLNVLYNKTILIATHSPNVADIAHRRISLQQKGRTNTWLAC
jgi:putative ABC transport system ATP-binding protein